MKTIFATIMIALLIAWFIFFKGEQAGKIEASTDYKVKESAQQTAVINNLKNNEKVKNKQQHIISNNNSDLAYRNKWLQWAEEARTVNNDD